MRTRWLVLAPLVGIVLATSGLSAHAGPTKTPQIKDASGDSPVAGADIVSVLFTTAGKGSGRSYVPKLFSVTMTLAGPVEAGPGLTYEVDAKTDKCGKVSFTYEPGTPYSKVVGVNGWADWGTCLNQAGAEGVELITVVAEGNKIIWEFGLKSTELKVGTVFSEFVARVDPSNPVVPFPSDATGTALGLIDKATGAGTWKLS